MGSLLGIFCRLGGIVSALLDCFGGRGRGVVTRPIMTPLSATELIYPSGTATAHLINSFHTPQGAKLAKYFCFY